MMFKTTVTTAMMISCIFASPVMARKECIKKDKDSAFNGFYMGLGSGVSFTHGSYKGHGSSSKKTLSTTRGVLFIGYGHKDPRSNFYTSIEPYAAINGNKQASKSVVFDGTPSRMEHKLTKGGAYGVSTRLGYVIGDSFLPHVRVGYEFNDSPLRVSAKSNAGENHGLVGKSRKHSLVLGAGMDYAFSQNWFGRLEYQHNLKKAKKFSGGKTNDHNNLAMLSVGYRF